MLFLSCSAEVTRHLAVAVLGHCQTLRRDALAVPVELGRLRDELHRVVSSDLELSPVADLAATVDRVTVKPCGSERKWHVNESAQQAIDQFAEELADLQRAVGSPSFRTIDGLSNHRLPRSTPMPSGAAAYRHCRLSICSWTH